MTVTGTAAALVLYEGNDQVFTITFTDPNNSGAPIDIAGATIECYFKNSAGDLDTAAVLKLSTATGEITITDHTNGVCQVAPTHTQLAINKVDGSNTTLFWRCDLILSSVRKTAIYGTATIVNL